jgi:hypothetical protein
MARTNNITFEMTGAGTLSRSIRGNHVAALWQCHAKLRDAAPSLYNHGSAAR